jgi:hypothetical protein
MAALPPGRLGAAGDHLIDAETVGTIEISLKAVPAYSSFADETPQASEMGSKDCTKTS